MSACSDKLLLIHGFVDGELDAANSVALEMHLRSCADCRMELERLDAVRARLKAHDLSWHASPELMARVARSLGEEVSMPKTPVRERPRGLVAMATGLAAAAALFLALPQLLYHGTQDELVASHVRSLLASHLTDVQNSDQHIVKPWFNGKIDFVPPVPELKEDGFPLAGGRLDYVDNKVIAAIVYHRRLHPINLFVRPAAATALPFAHTAQQDGYNILRWRKNGLEFWAVSDLNSKELGQFREWYEKAS